MFDKNKFAKIIQDISQTYDNQREFAEKSKINRTYLSQYMNMKLNDPPKPKILEKIANSSNGITTYDELMYICGYIDYGFGNYNDIKDLLEKSNITKDEWTHYWKDFYDLNLTYKEAIALDKLQDQLYNITINPKNLEKDKLYNCFDKNLFNNYTPNEIDRIWKAFFIYADSFDFINSRKKNENFSMPKHKKNNNIHKDINFSTEFKYYMCPVYGQISAGQPNWAEECIEGRLPIDPNLMGIIDPEECYFLRVNGESMNKIISNGAYALIRKTDWVENGEIAVVLVNGFDATLKRFNKQGDLIVLEPMSNDNSFQVQIYDKNTSIEIIGKYIGKFEMEG